MVFTAGSMFQSYHTLVPGINSFSRNRMGLFHMFKENLSFDSGRRVTLHTLKIYPTVANWQHLVKHHAIHCNNKMSNFCK